MIRSLRGRLLLGISLAGVAVFGLLALSVYAAMQHALMADFDASLQTDARLVAGMVDQDGPKVTFELDPQQMPDFLSQNRRHFFEIRREDGSVLARSPSLADQDLQLPTGDDALGDIDLPGGHRGRVFTLAFSPSPQEEDEKRSAIQRQKVTIVVAAEPLEVRRTLQLLAGMLAALCAAALVILGAVQMRVVGGAVRPIRQLAQDIESLRESDLDRRIAGGNVPDELAPVVEKLNGLLARLEQAFAREKCFTADVAHELRTPLAGLRSTLEVCRSRRRDGPDYEAALDECRGITDRMEAMVQSLLLLARSDAGQVKMESRRFDLYRAVSESWNLIQYRAARRGLNVAMGTPCDCPIVSDADKLQIVLQSVFDNAVSYTDDGGSVRISVASNGHGAKIEIANTGSQIASADTPRLFERFWRGDTARADAGLHCGLGLSLSQRLMALLGGEISIRTQKGGEFVVLLALPQRA